MMITHSFSLSLSVCVCSCMRSFSLWRLTFRMWMMNMWGAGRSWSKHRMNWPENSNSSETEIIYFICASFYHRWRLRTIPQLHECRQCPQLMCLCLCRYLIIENFIPPEEKNKIMNRLQFDAEEDQWKFQPLVPAEKWVNLHPYMWCIRYEYFYIYFIFTVFHILE